MISHRIFAEGQSRKLFKNLSTIVINWTLGI